MIEILENKIISRETLEIEIEVSEKVEDYTTHPGIQFEGLLFPKKEYDELIVKGLGEFKIENELNKLFKEKGKTKLSKKQTLKRVVILTEKIIYVFTENDYNKDIKDSMPKGERVIFGDINNHKIVKGL